MGPQRRGAWPRPPTRASASLPDGLRRGRGRGRGPAAGRPGWAARAPSAARRGPPLRTPFALRLRLRRPLGPPLPRRCRRRPPHVGRGLSPPRGRPARPGLAASLAARVYAASVAGEGPAPTAQRPAALGRARDVTARGGARRRARRFAAAGGATRRPPRFAAAPARTGRSPRDHWRRAAARARTGAGKEPGPIHPSGRRGSRRRPWPALPLPWRRVAGRPDTAPPRFCDVKVSPLDVTAGRCRGAWSARGRPTSGAGGGSRLGGAGRGEEFRSTGGRLGGAFSAF